MPCSVPWFWAAPVLPGPSSCNQQGPTSCSNNSVRSCHSPAHPTCKEGSASSAPCSDGKCCATIQTNLGCHSLIGAQGRRGVKVRNTSLHKARMQAANRVLPMQLGRGQVPPSKPILKLLPVGSLPQWNYRSDRAPGFSRLGYSSSSTQPCQHWSTFPCPCQPMEAGPSYATP